MGGFFNSSSSPKITQAVADAAPKPTAEASPSPATGGDAMGMADTRSPVTRASTMLSPRRRREDEMRPTVGTKQLLGQ